MSYSESNTNAYRDFFFLVFCYTILFVSSFYSEYVYLMRQRRRNFRQCYQIHRVLMKLWFGSQSIFIADEIKPDKLALQIAPSYSSIHKLEKSFHLFHQMKIKHLLFFLLSILPFSVSLQFVCSRHRPKWLHVHKSYRMCYCYMSTWYASILRDMHKHDMDVKYFFSKRSLYWDVSMNRFLIDSSV